MLPTHLTLISVTISGTTLSLALAGPLFAQGTSDPTREAVDQPSAAQELMREKVDAATAADSKYHANRTEANRAARDQAESEAAAAMRAAQSEEPTSR